MDFFIKISPIIEAVGSLIVAAATVILVWVTYKYVSLTNNILNINRTLLESQTNPQVVISLIARDGRLIVKLENVGNSPAINVLGQISPALDERLFHRQISCDTIPLMLKQFHLAPNQTIEGIIGYTREILARQDLDNIHRQYRISISYSSLKIDSTFQHNYEVDLSGALIPKKSRMETIGFKLDKIKMTLEAITKALHQIKV